MSLNCENGAYVYREHAHYTKSIHIIQRAGTLCREHAHYMERIHIIQRACTLHREHAHYTGRDILRMCTAARPNFHQRWPLRSPETSFTTSLVHSIYPNCITYALVKLIDGATTIVTWFTDKPLTLINHYPLLHSWYTVEYVYYIIILLIHDAHSGRVFLVIHDKRHTWFSWSATVSTRWFVRLGSHTVVVFCCMQAPYTVAEWR